jgi:hypothetical protein
MTTTTSWPKEALLLKPWTDEPKDTSVCVASESMTLVDGERAAREAFTFEDHDGEVTSAHELFGKPNMSLSWSELLTGNVFFANDEPYLLFIVVVAKAALLLPTMIRDCGVVPNETESGRGLPFQALAWFV